MGWLHITFTPHHYRGVTENILTWTCRESAPIRPYEALLSPMKDMDMGMDMDMDMDTDMKQLYHRRNEA
jgi:hypothetical protein